MGNIGYCGDDCESCPRYIATKDNDFVKLQAVAVLWKNIGLYDDLVSPKKMVCDGCESIETCHYNDIRECARGAKISNCGQCDDYPCDRIKMVFDRTCTYARQWREM
jgi:hypothetical protein